MRLLEAAGTPGSARTVERDPFPSFPLGRDERGKKPSAIRRLFLDGGR
jgi:hypothetical protein